MSVRQLAGGGAIIYGAYKLLQHFSTSKHNRVLKDAFDEVEANSSSQATILVDHIDPRGSEGQPVTYGGYRPDLVLQDFDSPNIIAEVETSDSLNSSAKSQLEAFKQPGYTRALVVPSSAKADAEEFVTNIDGAVRVFTPSELGDFVW